MAEQRTVILIAGFGVPTASLRPLARTLRATGAHIEIAPTGLNVDCGERTVARLLALVDDQPGRVAIAGHSRGGQLGRVVAVRRPERVDALVTAGTPWTVGPPARPGVDAVAQVIRRVTWRGRPVLGAIDCAHASCCADFRADLERKPVARWTALWSSRDRIAGDDARPPDEADAARDIGTTHLGFVLSGTGRGAIASALDVPGVA